MRYEEERDKEVIVAPIGRLVPRRTNTDRVRDLTATQARLCEQRNHFAMAAILWRRINKMDEAITCEIILTKLAVNFQYDLLTMTAVIIS